MTTAAPPPTSDTRTRILETAFRLFRQRGFAATSVADLCAASGVTKGAFFHHFASKEALGVAVARHWAETTGAFFAGADYHAPADPLERVLAYVAFRRALLGGAIEDYTCVAGTLVQEVHAAHPPIREACCGAIDGHAATLEADIAAAVAERGMNPDWTPKSLARHTQVVLQGAFVLAKAMDDVEVARESVDHLARYIRILFGVEDGAARAPGERPAARREAP